MIYRIKNFINKIILIENIMTIKKTLDIIDGNLTPSTQRLDADLIEVSSASGNALKVVEDGLFVTGSTGGGSTIPTILIDSTLTNEVSRENIDVVTLRFKLPITGIDSETTVYFTPAPFLSVFKKIDSIFVDNNSLARGPDGGSILQVAPQLTSYKTNGTTYLLGKQGLYTQTFIRDLSVDLPEIGANTINMYAGYYDGSTYNLYIDDVLTNESFGSSAGATIIYLNSPLEAGQVIKITGSYPMNGETGVGETLTFTVGDPTPPVLTLVRPPLNKFEDETSFAIVTITGELK